MHLFLLMLKSAASLGFVAAVIGSVYVLILTKPGHILDFWAEWLRSGVKWIVTKTTKEDWKRTKREEYILKPILECELCVSGQIALWTYIFTQPFNILGLIFSICLSILLAWLIARMMNR